jgi:tetratricopeptide (TPR) repeat protein
MKYAATVERRYLDPFHSSIEKGIAIAEELPADTPDRGVLLGELHLLRGIMRLTRKEYFAAGKDLKAACGYATDVHAEFPDDVEHLKVMGAIEVGLSAVPGKLRWLGNLLCLRGDLKGGTAHLGKSSGEATLMREESTIILAYIDRNLMDRSEEGRKRIEALNASHPGCYPYRYLLALTYLDSRNADAALHILQQEETIYGDDTRIFRTPFWTFNKASALYYRADLPAAEKAFDDFLAAYRGEAGIGDATFRLGMAKALSGNQAGAKVTFGKLAQNEKKGWDADAYCYQLAMRYTQRSITPTEVLLFRSRNFFDGGYFQKALKELSMIGTAPAALSTEDRTELWYRQGRILQEMGEKESAKAAFGKCILEKPGFNLWMKVYAHFYLGQLMQETGRPDLAKKLYNAALGFDNFYYQNGLEQRCKAALASI